MIKIITTHGETVWVAKAHVVTIRRVANQRSTDKIVYKVLLMNEDEFLTFEELWNLFA